MRKMGDATAQASKDAADDTQVTDVSTGNRGDLEPPASSIAWVPSSSGKDADFYMRPSPEELPTNSSQRLPLELFDSPNFEPVPPEELILTAEGVPGAGARSRYYLQSGEFTWKPCRAVAYDADTGYFTVVWEESGKEKRVKRLNLLFDSESPEAFSLRLGCALSWQAQAEDAQRFARAAAEVPLQEAPLHYLDQRWADSVRERAGWLAERWPDVVADVLAEARDGYDEAVRCAILEHKLGGQAPQPKVPDTPAARAALLTLKQQRPRPPVPRVACASLSPAALASGCEVSVVARGAPVSVPLAREPIESAFDVMEVLLPVGRPECVAALQELMGGLDMRDASLADVAMPSLRRPALLSDFTATQSAATARCFEKLHNDWYPLVTGLVERILPEGCTGKAAADVDAAAGDEPPQRPASAEVLAVGSVGLSERTRRELAVYTGRRLARLGSAIATDQLRSAVLRAVAEYAQFWEQYAPREAEEAEDGAEKAPPPTPLFRIIVDVDDETGAMVFEPALEEVSGAVLAVFDSICSVVTGLPEMRFALLGSGPEQMLTTVQPDEPAVAQARAACAATLEAANAGPLALVAGMQRFSELAQLSEADFLSEWAEKGGLREREAEAQRLAAVADQVRTSCDDNVSHGMFHIATDALRTKLGAKALRLRLGLLQQLADGLRAQNGALAKQCVEMAAQLTRVPANPEELDAVRKYADATPMELARLTEEVAAATAVYNALEEARLALEDTDVNCFWDAAAEPARMAELLEGCREQMAASKELFVDGLRGDQSGLAAEVAAIAAAVEALTALGDLSKTEERMAVVYDVEERLAAAQAQADLYASREEIFGAKATEWPQIEEASKAFEASAFLWRTASELATLLPMWLDGPFGALNPEEMSQTVDKWWRGTLKNIKSLRGEGPMEVAEKIKGKVQQFQENLPLVVALRNPGMRKRHWERLSATVGFEVDPASGFSLSRALELELPKHIAAVEEVGEVAAKEFGLERTLDKMQADWTGVVLAFTEWRDTKTYILKGLDEIQMLLDDQIVKTQSMRASPFIGPFEDRVRLWEKKLNMMQEILDAWLTCQQAWLYLEPIFGSDDILQQMPVEGRKFKAVDQTWRRTMEKAAKNPEVLLVCQDEELLKALTDANRHLEQVQKGLADYLETKRLAFPRFYFLSNEELLEILSETKDPTRVQPFLRKCFEGINKLEFQPDLEVVAMLSEEGESVPLCRTFNPKTAQGNVERWLIDCEQIMRETCKAVTNSATDAYARKPRKEWILQWPGQVVICASQIYWTSETTAAIDGQAVQGYADKCTAQLADIVELVRGKLSKLDRKTLSALVTIDVHARDVVQELADQKVSSSSDFEWLSQLRYYPEADPEVPGGKAVRVRMINAMIPYGYEYLGNSSRLVITPLTDRCYRTLMGALHLDLGGAPEGPAGTGKTETTKDLAKAIAMQCVVFNCSDGLDYLAMAKFFKGLAASGCWACFDEFNRIDLEVLSVVAQQILTIVRAKKANLKVFEFEGTRLGLRRTCNVFITMNPGYAGRSELPDNLKALFRTVAMMVPDYGLISEIILYSNGYLAARDLARKLVATYRLCSEQLSSQSHYDYGMRAVISVLRAAGALKQQFADQEEAVLMLRALKDVNLPKFLAPDIPLFEGILSDLFPGTILPQADYTDLLEALHSNCAKLNLQPTPVFIEKVLQLYEMILVRHGLMIVGYSYGAKTSAWRALAGALTDLKEAGKLTETAERTRTVVINPKSITMGQLYGQFDAVSHEWCDGVLAKKFRDCAVDTSPDRKWVLFDGPVDAVWIENMNTVLDDNKKLCLMSGEIVQMSNSMNMIFEVQDLLVASPATVSRCGMVYVEPSEIGWRPLFTSWLATLPATLTEELKGVVAEMMEWLIDPCLRFVRKYCKELVPTSDINLPESLLRLFVAHLEAWTKEGAAPPAGDAARMHIESIFLFSLVWSLGGTTESSGRTRFDKFLRRMLSKQAPDVDLGPGLDIKPPSWELAAPFPAKGDVYEYCFDAVAGQWTHWMETVEAVKPDPAQEFSNIIVQTIDTVRYDYLLRVLVKAGTHVLFGGPTGTGKTVYIKDGLSRLDKQKYCVIESTFSAQTTANQVQDIIDSRLDKRRKGVFGPPFGQRAVVFVDDLNMPTLEVYGAQPPVELLRQFKDHGGWYDRSDQSFRQLMDMQFVAAMGPPGGGRNPVTPRYLRHYNLVSVCEFSGDSMGVIYQTVVNWWVQRSAASTELMDPLSAPLVAATLEVYNTIRAELLPTPAKSHYTFNLRDISKVFQGIAMVATPPEDGPQLTRLWCHECLRVFSDRLVSEEDRAWFASLQRRMVDQHLGLRYNDAFLQGSEDNDDSDNTALRSLSFADFLAGADKRPYAEVTDEPRLLAVIEERLVEYNQQSKTRMDLVLFRYAAQHVCRISRVLRQPGGNALLVGVGGSGRSSLTRVAAWLADMPVFSIEISKSYTNVEWREDLRKVLRRAGAEGTPTVFLFADTQLKEESFLEDVNNILNTGEVPNLFPKDEVMGILEAVRVRAKKAGADAGGTAALWAFFVSQCRANLHVVLPMSPVGDAFRTRLRMFPALVNCCTIDWFSEWPEEALASVAGRFLRELDMTPEVRQNIVKMCMVFHVSVTRLSVRFKQEVQRDLYITPTSYLELITTYKGLLGAKRDQVGLMKKRYTSGLEKLLSAEGQVGDMKVELTALQPVLVQTAKETAAMLVVIDRETIDANKTRVDVAADEAVAAEKAAAAKAIKDECEGELAVAMPLLAAALSALDTLSKSDITEMKSMKSPPGGVKLVMEAVCQIKGIKSKKVNDPNDPTKKIDDYWTPAQGLLSEANFLQSLQTFDKDNIPPDIVAKIRPYCSMPEFEPDVIKKVSKAAYGLCCWVRAMEAYDRVAKVVAPKKAKLAEAEAEFNELMVGLNAKRAELKAVEDKLAQLNASLAEMQAKKAQLEKDADLCSKKLVRAEKLIGGLGGEKTRWTAVSASLGVDYTNLTGDVMLASGFIAYLGAFTQPFREAAAHEWTEACSNFAIPCSAKFSLMNVLGEPVKIRDWIIDGLPNDAFSIDNGIIMSKARRWPLCIDPQGQANKWIKNMEKKNSLEVVKLSDGDYLRKLENCIQFGFPVLLENVVEELDPTLEPLLSKSTFKQGGGLCIRLGDSTIDYSENFRFYITTKLRNPHYLPEVSVKVTLLNFMITPEGLIDQLLGVVVAKERPDLEEEKTKLVLQGAENARALKGIEDQIIEILSSSEGNILEDETAIDVISASKVLSNEIDVKQQIASKTEAKIDAAREAYRPVAVHVTWLFFCIADLCTIEPMYQYSLTWFISLFLHAIKNSEMSDNVQTRCANLRDFFTYFLYCNICRSLFEKDKLLFSFLLCYALFANVESTIDRAEFRFLLTGGIAIERQQAENPGKGWISEKLWGEANRLGDFASFKGFAEALCADIAPWREIYDSESPQSMPLPQPWEKKLTPFHRLLVMRIIRPDKLVPAIQLYVEAVMGRRFVEPPPFDLSGSYNDSNCCTPLIFVLSPGSDPMAALLKFAETKGAAMHSLSLGQGQGPKAEALITSALTAGSWVVLQNCHLAVSWMPTMERICEGVTPATAHANFRLWLTSYPSGAFPVAVLQSSVKMTNEPPKGLRANLLTSYINDPISDPAFFGGCTKKEPWQRLLFSLCFFHAHVQERLKFGPLGWNIPYQFNATDLKISVEQLRMFLEEYDQLPISTLRYTAGECNYGGRVTDSHDRVTLVAILSGLYTEQVMDDSYRFSPSGLFYPPPAGTYEEALEYIRALPLVSGPEAFGLHANADISKDQQETDLLLESVLMTQSRATAVGGKSKEEVLGELAGDIAAKMPKVFDLEAANYKYPVEYFESMNTVLRQELVRYNRLIAVVHSTLANFSKALKGQVVMSADLEALGNSMYDGKLPALWAGQSYPSMKPLGSYVSELRERLAMLQGWIDHGAPTPFWITGFFFTHAFLTGVLQNYARKHKVPIDTVVFQYKCMPEGDYSLMPPPEDGAYVYGMFMEGARWDYKTMQIAESEPKVLHTVCPIVWLQPVEQSKKRAFPHYSCPVYRTTERRGVLATTGHSSNFVSDIALPTDLDSNHWTKRGVAMLLSLST